jgi:hypothetical protein
MLLVLKKKRKINKPSLCKLSKDKKKWFNHECYNGRHQFNVARNYYLRHKTIENKNIYLNKKVKYYSVKNKCKKTFQK